MAMNREQRRYLQRQGQVDKDGNVVARRVERSAPTPEERDSPKQFLKGVRTELNRVTWPSRAEVINYSICLLYTSPSPRDRQKSRMPSSA